MFTGPADSPPLISTQVSPRFVIKSASRWLSEPTLRLAAEQQSVAATGTG